MKSAAPKKASAVAAKMKAKGLPAALVKNAVKKVVKKGK